MAAEGLAAGLMDKGVFVGFAVQHDTEGRAESLALATVEEVLIIRVDKPSELLTHDKPFEDLLRGDSYTLVGFDMGRLVVRIAKDLKLRVRGIDLSTAFRANTWDPPLPSDVVKSRLFQSVNPGLVNSMWIDEPGPREMCLRAWLAVCVAENNAHALESVVRLDTKFLSSQEVTLLAELVRQARVLDRAKPKETPGEFTKSQLNKDGTLALQNSRYKTRLRRGDQTVIMTNEDGQEFFGEAHGCKGRTTNIRFTGQALSGKLENVRVSGPPALTNTEKARNELVLRVQQGHEFLRTSSFIQMLWFPTKKTQALIMKDAVSIPVTHFEGLNPSQEAVASKMVSDCPLVITHGPPGTGKTTTIAAAVSVWEKKRLPTWIIAHSNVAVKNMAETLFKMGIDFKVLVSKEFHFEWHQHIYERIDEKVLVSDEFLAVKDQGALSRLLDDSCIILSTLGMLSNPTLDRIGMFRVVPVGRLVVDEASQIKIEDFLHILHRFAQSLKKLCFFGDPKQLPPYGIDQVPEIKTIFDFPHLQDMSGFLDTQYRMPVQLGQFISRYVYDGRLESEHAIRDTYCVTFVDTISGSEKKSGLSWINEKEIQALVNIVKTYCRHRKFCIITPYDAQRAAIERRLKDENLPWEHVFNVDSFQGNETDFVLVSVVRSGQSPGFLSSQNRMNVLLTRCKKGLVIVTSRSFIKGGGRDTLLGDLERQWMQIQGNGVWVDWRTISEGTADLPDAPGPNRHRRGVLFQHDVRSSPVTVSVVSPPSQRTFDVRSLFPRRPMTNFHSDDLSSRVPTKTSDSFYNRLPLTSRSTIVGALLLTVEPWSERVTHSAASYKMISHNYDDEFPELTPAAEIISKTAVHQHSWRRKSAQWSEGAENKNIKSSVHGSVVRRLQISDQQITRARSGKARP